MIDIGTIFTAKKLISIRIKYFVAKYDFIVLPQSRFGSQDLLKICISEGILTNGIRNDGTDKKSHPGRGNFVSMID